jgi:hypothetical protein
MIQSVIKKTLVILSAGFALAASAAGSEAPDMRRMQRDIAAAAPSVAGEINRMDDYNMAATICPVARLAHKSAQDFNQLGEVAVGSTRAGRAE